MFYGNTVQDTRPLFFLSWQKFLAKQPLSPLEQQLVDVITIHPEYHHFFEQTDAGTDRVYHPSLGEPNPFFHLGLHLALRDQVATNRPVGIQPMFHQMVLQYGDPMAVEHRMMEVLSACLWESQEQGVLSDDHYLAALVALQQSFPARR